MRFFFVFLKKQTLRGGSQETYSGVSRPILGQLASIEVTGFPARDILALCVIANAPARIQALSGRRRRRQSKSFRSVQGTMFGIFVLNLDSYGS